MPQSSAFISFPQKRIIQVQIDYWLLGVLDSLNWFVPCCVCFSQGFCQIRENIPDAQHELEANLSRVHGSSAVASSSLTTVTKQVSRTPDWSEVPFNLYLRVLSFDCQLIIGFYLLQTVWGSLNWSYYIHGMIIGSGK